MKVNLTLGFILVIHFTVFSQIQNTKKEEQQSVLIGAYKIVDTNQEKYFNNTTDIERPQEGAAFYGQDAEYRKNKPSYADNGDGTVTDNVTGLVWQKSFEVMSYAEAIEKVKTFNLANRTDWRIPSIKEAYSLIQFNGVDVSSNQMSSLPKSAKPFIDTAYFDFEYGSNGDRVIDVQLLSSTIYQGTTMGGAKTVFGVNLADGRIKGYPMEGLKRNNDAMNKNTSARSNNRNEIKSGERPGGPAGEKLYTVRFVCGNSEYGKNNFKNNNNGTISDLATGLMWSQNDSQKGMNWKDALAYVQKKNKDNYLGFNDWRLPNAKELQSIVDYSRSPQKTASAAINAIFKISEIKDEVGKSDFPFFWTSTTHENQRGGETAIYVCFGESPGFMRTPRSNAISLMDVHGAGSQRSDPKEGNASDYPQGRGPQGDVIRINNYVRLVRDIN
ncbi:DUF1566 domain-containing protein [Mariniflexile sp.]|uniref:Lcl C-terminal domain-containing protein n=1 Tax=Mariniflexile sp. TaxID=1979402 RepID=UPI00356A39F9